VSSSFKLGIFFLETRRVKEYYLRYLGGRWCAVNFASETFAGYPGNKTAVVYMGMRQQNCIYALRRDGTRFPVSVLEISFLVKPAVDENPRIICFQKIPGAGNIPGGAPEA